MIKKDYINFLPKKSLFPKKWSNTPPEQFFAVFSENTAVYEKIILYESIWHLIFDKKGYIRFHFYKRRSSEQTILEKSLSIATYTHHIITEFQLHPLTTTKVINFLQNF